MNNQEISAIGEKWGVSPEKVDEIINSREIPESRILRAIQIGKKQAIYSYTLQKRLSMDHRLIEQAVYNLRNEGFPIVGGNCGYYVASDWIEGKKCFESLHNRAMATLAGITKIRRTLKDAGAFDEDNRE